MYQLRHRYEVDCVVSFVDDAGDPASVDGAPQWVVSDASVLTVNPAPDGMSAVLQATGDTIGAVATLTVTADADLGDGVIAVVASEDVQVVSGQASAASFSFGEPRPI